MPRLNPGPAVLFVPSNRPERFAKGAAAADTVILDLEDGAGNCDRNEARSNIANSGLDPQHTIVRVCGPDDEGFADDVAAIKNTNFHTIMVPKVQAELPDILDGFDIIAMIETPTAVINLPHIAADPRVVGLFWGAEDLTQFLGGTHSRIQPDEGGPTGRPGPYRTTMSVTRSLMHLHAAANGKYVLDAVHADFKDDAGQYEEAADAARSGFAGTCCIHPAQVPVIRRAYTPDEHQLQWARRVVEEAQAHPGAFKLDGEMIDAPLINQAHRVVSRADNINPA
ncbi:HpcH/HpaI aldolase/citrate lyase family protein [Corynebacterium aquilae]|uniref:Citrate lyase subunit beta n=1 Tax=Corynebacterium aquilae DSM 44791 TaxID=1431546 RepID=A0A1L7CER3_9CORY|nr:CoA ester lyase [Corynebacterium aquilae]APT84336.1 citrate lyase subunit beta [Corynebacterium aquilae DSM 44791]